MSKLIDQHGRHIHKLRLSVLDRCNFRCFYCMPENQQFLPSEKLMSKEQIFNISSILVDQHEIDEIRITGGEPCLRPDLIDIMLELSKLDIKKLGLTTNGMFLKKDLPLLAKTKCKYLNVSLDSLNQKGFKKLAGRDGLQQVLESIFMAKELGFVVKINTVLMKGINDQEINDFVNFSLENDIELRFLELMKIGVGQKYFDTCFMSADTTQKIIETKYSLEKVNVPLDSTCYKFKVNGKSDIGFIASESKPFCSGCSRLRLSAMGEIRPCLMLNSGISLLEKNEEEVEQILLSTISQKPIDRIENVTQNMNQIGG